MTIRYWLFQQSESKKRFILVPKIDSINKFNCEIYQQIQPPEITNMDTQIKSIHRSDTFEIIQTSDDFYYSPKDNPGNPQRLYLNQWCDTITSHLPKSEKSDYWAFNLLCAREVMHLYKGSQEIYQFEDRTKTISRLEMDLIGFHVLNDRWVVVLEYCERDRTSYNNIKSYSYAGEYILIMTSTHIAKIIVAPDYGDGWTKLDYKIIPNNIGLGQQATRENIWDVSLKQVSRLGPDGTRISQINVYMPRLEYIDVFLHSIRSHNSLIGTINPETLENTGVFPNPTELLPGGGVNYLAPDIVIHRPDLHVLTQYFTLLAPEQSQQPTLQQKLIQVNIHDYEPKKEQRNLYVRYWNDDGRFFTLICSKWTDTRWLIYQVDRLTRTIAFMRVKVPANDLTTEIQHDGQIVISKFDIFRETVRVIEPAKTDISAVLTGIPGTAAEFIAKFAEQKIINY